MRNWFLGLFLFLLFIQPVPVQAGEGNKNTAAGKESNPPMVHIFMYHVIDEGPNGLYVPETDFEEQIKLLSEQGYKSATLSQLPEILKGAKGKPGDKWVILTLDDGYVSLYDNAFPILKKYGFTATAFIITEMVDTPNHVTWEQLKELQRYGIEIGCHTETHPYLYNLEQKDQQREIAGAKEKLEQKLNIKVVSFSYPYGAYNDQVIEEVRKNGFTEAVTVNTGIFSPLDDAYTLPRVNIYGGMRLESLAQILRFKPGQYDNNLAAGFNAVDLNPLDEKAYLSRGMAYDNLGRYELALADYDKAIEINPEFPDPYNGKGYIYNKLGQQTESIANYTKSCELAPTFPYPFNNRAKVYVEIGEYDKAIGDLNKVIEMDPNFPYLASTYNKKGYAYAKLGNYQQALADCSKSIELNADYADAYNSRGYTYYHSGQAELAETDLNRAIELDPNQPLYYFNLSNVYKTLGQEYKAEASLKKVLELEANK